MAALYTADVSTFWIDGAGDTCEPGIGYQFWKVEFWKYTSEDGSEQVAVVTMLQNEQEARDAAAFWSTGGHKVATTLFRAESPLQHEGF